MEHLLTKCKENWFFVLLIILIFIEIVILSGDFIRNFNEGEVDDLSIREYAQSVIETCSEESYITGCYDKEVPKLMDYISMEEAFEVTKVIQTEGDTEYAYCHVLGHNVSAKETAKDPAKWKDVITRCPTGMCSNGCIHGAFQERFRTEAMTDAEIDAITPDLKTVCESRGEWSPTGMERATCYHAVGHLLMYITGGDIYKSKEVCERLDSAYVWLCFDGSFMQIFQPLELEDFDLVKDIPAQTQEEAESFCDSFDGLAKASCHQESWPLYYKEIMTSTGLVEFCSYTEDLALNDKCYKALLHIIPVQVKLDVPKIIEFCSALPDTQKGTCFTSAASRMIETDYNLGQKAVSLCNKADEYGVGDECYDHLIIQSTFNYHPSSIESQYLCNLLPTMWKAQCEEKQ